MIFYYIFAVVILLIQGLVLVEAYRHLIFTIRKYRPQKYSYQPKVALIAPCKGLDTTFDKNMNSFFHLDYPAYEIYFVVESKEDPAYGRLADIIAEQKARQNPVKTHLLVAGFAESCGQKVHNQLVACEAVSAETEVFAFVDSDACLKPHWMSSLVHPLRRADIGAATGYRWFVPTDHRLSSHVLSAINSYIASLLGPHPWNSAWGGSMAIRRDIFEKLQLREAFKTACTDDYMLTYMVKKANLHIAFVPACFVASYEHMSWSELYAFGRRQFVLTRVYMPRLWWLAVLGLGHYIVAFWLGIFVTAYLAVIGSPHVGWAAILPGALLAGSIAKAVTRQVMITKILPEDRKKLRISALIDIFFQPMTSILTFVFVISAGISRTIVWRGIRYYLRDIYHMEIDRSRTNQ